MVQSVNPKSIGVKYSLILLEGLFTPCLFFDLCLKSSVIIARKWCKKPLPPSNNIRIKIHFIFQDVTVWFSKNFNRIRIFECEIRIRNTPVCTKMMDYRPNVGHALLVPVHIFFGSEFDPDSPGSTDPGMFEVHVRVFTCVRIRPTYIRNWPISIRFPFTSLRIRI